jgi:hypothetical protein
MSYHKNSIDKIHLALYRFYLLVLLWIRTSLLTNILIANKNLRYLSKHYFTRKLSVLHTKYTH